MFSEFHHPLLSWILDHLLVTFHEYIFIALVIIVAYTLLTMVNFETSLLAAPFLAIHTSVANTIPILTLLDFKGVILNIIHGYKGANFKELFIILPFTAVGAFVGVALLIALPPTLAVISLAIFILTVAALSFIGYRPFPNLTPWMCIPFGLFGGFFSGLFGSGQLTYFLYMHSRIPSKEEAIATTNLLINANTILRAIFFLIAGTYFNIPLLVTAALLYPPMVVGVFIGRMLHTKMPSETLSRIINILIFIAGIILLIHLFLQLMHWI